MPKSLAWKGLATMIWSRSFIFSCFRKTRGVSSRLRELFNSEGDVYWIHDVITLETDGFRDWGLWAALEMTRCETNTVLERDVRVLSLR